MSAVFSVLNFVYVMSVRVFRDAVRVDWRAVPCACAAGAAKRGSPSYDSFCGKHEDIRVGLRSIQGAPVCLLEPLEILPLTRNYRFVYLLQNSINV